MLLRSPAKSIQIIAKACSKILNDTSRSPQDLPRRHTTTQIASKASCRAGWTWHGFCNYRGPICSLYKAVSCKTLIGALNALGCVGLGSRMYCPPASESENMSLYVWDPTMQEPCNKHHSSERAGDNLTIFWPGAKETQLQAFQTCSKSLGNLSTMGV